MPRPNEIKFKWEVQQRNKLYRTGMAYYQHDMLSIKSRTVLANILAEVVLLSESLQGYREALADIPFFDCIALFRFLDREQKGYLREKDFQRVVGTSHRKLLTYAFSWFDSMKVGEISRLEFAAFLLPKDDLSLRQLVAERVENPEISYAQHQTLLQQFDIFRRMLIEVMNREMRIIELRRELVGEKDYSSKGALVAIDGHDHHWLCSEDLFKFLKNYGFEVGLRQVEKLMEIINSSLDGRISQQQLAWVLEGFETKNKAYLSKIKASNKKEEEPPIKYAGETEKAISNNPTLQKKVSEDIFSRFEQLTEKMREAERIERQADQSLIHCDQLSIQQNKILLQQKLEEANRQKAIRIAAERQQALMEQYHKHELQQQLLKQAALIRENERLIRLERRLQMTYAEPLPKTSSPVKYNRRLYSFAEESPARKTDPAIKEFQIIDAHLPRKNYQNLTNLNSLSIVESYRRASQASDVRYQLSDSTAHFNSQDLHTRIKQEIEQEKAIQDRLNKGEYSSKFIRSPPTPNPPSERKPSEASKYQPETFESPERVPNFRKSASNKFTVSTGNKLSDEKA